MEKQGFGFTPGKKLGNLDRIDKLYGPENARIKKVLNKKTLDMLAKQK